MYLIICFFLGIGNFALHRAVVESGHPFVEDTKIYFGRHIGRNASYILELGVLAGAMILSHGGALSALLAYMLYSAMNGVAAWLLLSGRV
jgi:hypothetical protein